MYERRGTEIDNGTIEHQPFKRTAYRQVVDVGHQEAIKVDQDKECAVEVGHQGVVEHEGVVEVGHQEVGHQGVVEVEHREVEVEHQEVGYQGMVEVGHREGAEVKHHKLNLVELQH